MTSQTATFAQPRIPIFRAGTHTSSDGRRVTITVADLEEIADSYEPTLSRAPHVIGHPDMDHPAWGWVKHLTVDGDYLVIESEQVELNFAQMVNEGRFPNRSASFYLADTPGNPKPGRKYLKHVGWLGAMPPAVVGLPAVKFAADSQALCFSYPASDADHPKESPQMEQTAEELQRQKDELAQREQDLNTRAQKIAQDEADLDRRKAEEERTDAVQFAQGLEKAGKLLPTEVQPVVELLLAQSKDAPLSFSQAGTEVKKPAGDVLRDLLAALPSRIDYREKSGGNGDLGAAVSFAAPAGSVIDQNRADLHTRATQYQQRNPGIGWVDAVKACGG